MKIQKKTFEKIFLEISKPWIDAREAREIFWIFLGDLQGEITKKWLFLKVSNRRKMNFWPARILEIWKPFFKYLAGFWKYENPFSNIWPILSLKNETVLRRFDSTLWVQRVERALFHPEGGFYCAVGVPR